MGNTPNYTWPYPELTDPPDGAGQIKALALAVDTSLKTVDTRAADSGNKDAITLTPATGWGTVAANGRRFGSLCVVHWVATRTGAAIAAAANGNISDSLVLNITDVAFQPHYSAYSGFANNNGSFGRCFLNPSTGALYIAQYGPNLALNTGDALAGTLVYVGGP